MMTLATARMLDPLCDRERAMPTRATQLELVRCETDFARSLIAAWHSRLPKTQRGPWQYAFAACFDGVAYAVALWNNPSARCLPQHWAELRRMAVADDAPHCTASRFLAMMERWFCRNAPHREVLCSYQDEAVHQGTIYRAAGWTPAFRSAPRQRDRSANRVGTDRAYRSDMNGIGPAASGKVRWEKRVPPGTIARKGDT